MLRLWCVTLIPFAVLAALLRWATPVGLAVAAAVVLATIVAAPLLDAWVLTPRGVVNTPAAMQAPLPGVDDARVATFFYPGLGGCWTQALRYAGRDGLPASMQLLVHDPANDTMRNLLPPAHIRNAPRLLAALCPIDPPEVVPTDGWQWLPWFYTLAVTPLARFRQRAIMGDDYAVAWPWFSFAQRDDVDAFLAPIRRYWDQLGDRRIVLAGSSRGASTVLAAAAELTTEERARVAFVLLEGAFDSVYYVAHARFGPWLGAAVTDLLPWLTRFDPAFPTPLEMARHFPRDLPVLFVTSEADTVVPMAHTLHVRNVLVSVRSKEQAARVHTLVLKHSDHSFYTNDELDDQRAYRAMMELMHRTYL
jgi:hypothetical protein